MGGSSCAGPADTPQTRSLRREVNRGRREIRALESQATTPEATGFPGAQQIARRRRRVRRQGKSSTETVCLIGSRPLPTLPTLPAQELAELERAYWTIESALHYRLDEVLDEDRSRVRTPRAAHVPGMFRRLTVSFALPWSPRPPQFHGALRKISRGIIPPRPISDCGGSRMR